ncbi:uncharacterized protein [Diadema antillarum]
MQKLRTALDDRPPPRKIIWEKGNLFVQVSKSQYGMGDADPLFGIKFYKKEQEGQAHPLQPDRIPADIPQQLEDVTVRIYTSVIGCDTAQALEYIDNCIMPEILLPNAHVQEQTL